MNEKDKIERNLRLIATEINLWRTPWQSLETPFEEKSLIFKRVINLIEEEKKLKQELECLRDN